MSNRGKINGRARPIKTRRDYKGAADVVKHLSGQAQRDSTAELRLQALLQEMDRFEEIEEEASADSPEDYDYPGPRRRWSDDGGG